MFRLALQLGEPNPYHLAEKIPANLFKEWQVFEELEPFGPARDNYHTAQLAALYANSKRKKGTPPHTVDDFMYYNALDLEAKKEAKLKADNEAFLARLRTEAKPKPAAKKVDQDQ